MTTLLLGICLLPVAALAQDFGTGPAKVSPETGPRVEANAALEARDYEKALKLLGPLAAAHPQDSRILYDLGSSQDALDQASVAEASYRAAIADDGVYLEPRVALGLLLARNARMEGARTEFAGAAAITSGDAALRGRALRALARIDERTRPADARDELLEALKITPETPEDTLMAAELAGAATGGSGAAEAAYRRVLLERPNDAEASAGLARLMVKDKHVGEAVLLLTKALEAHPGDPGLTVQLASTYAAAGKSALAVPLVESLARTDPANGDISRLLAGLYVDTGAWEKAAPLLAGIIVRDPRDVRSADDLGRTLVHLRRYAEAEAVLKRIVAQPALFASRADFGDAAGHLAFAASENNDPEGALQAVAARGTVSAIPAPLLFVAAISQDKLHRVKLAQQAYQDFLAASNGANPNEEFEARHRLVALEHMK